VSEPHRLYIDRAPDADGRLALPEERSHYLIRVLRLEFGDRVIGFSGDGTACEFEVLRADPRRCLLTARGVVGEEPRPTVRLQLAQALLKGEKMDWVVQKSTELGATDLWLVDADHGEVRIEPRRLDNRLTHWRKIAISACEQCGRLWLPEIHAPRDFDAVSTAVSARERYFLDPGYGPLLQDVQRLDTVIAVGPEGGWSERERTSARAAGFTFVGLGAHVLRADTAPVVGLTLVRHAWGWH
jgi:16S rRNA (uracil1498-N3)-methyltransferase